MELIFFIGTEVAGGTCLWLVALLCSTLLFSCLHWRQSHLVRAGKPWWRDSALWLLVLVTLCLCTVISASFFQVIRFAGFDEAPAPDSWLMILMVILSLSILLSFMLKKWPRAKVQWNSWKTFQGFAVVYLVAILAMAFFRTQMVAYLVAMYQ